MNIQVFATYRDKVCEKFRLALFLFLVLGPAEAVARAVDEDSAANESECAVCHDEIIASFRQNPHSALDTRPLADLADASSSCEACHGNPEDHLLEGGGIDTIFGFDDETAPNVVTETCQRCHLSDHPRFDSSSHARVGLSCVGCHTVHDPQSRFAELEPWQEFRDATKSERVSGSCRSCHPDVFSQFEFNERHRLQEGILDCTTCHDPHTPSNRGLLGGFRQSLCADCHAAKDGPFVFEHGTSRVEGCVSCHAAHGSPNRQMLAFQNVADLCYSCHSVVTGFHASFGPDNQCTNCHSSIHGSNLSAFFLK